MCQHCGTSLVPTFKGTRYCIWCPAVQSDLVQEWEDNWASHPWPAAPKDMSLTERAIRQRLKTVENWGNRAAAEIKRLERKSK